MIKRPLITEKTMLLAKSGLYTFEVESDATKFIIAQIVAAKFKVDVLSVKMINEKSKKKMQKSRKGYFQTAPLKKAMVQVKPGQKIALFETAVDDSTGEKDVKVTTVEGEQVGTIKEKKSLLSGTKVKIEKTNDKVAEERDNPEERSRQQAGKTKGEK